MALARGAVLVLLEISLHPAGFRPFVKLCDVDFCEDILDSLENKVQIRKTRNLRSLSTF